MEWITEMTTASGTHWALGVQARSRALVTGGDDADAAFGEAISWLEQTQVRAELARTHLLYGEWLRRERRRIEARDHLRTAHRMLEAMGMESFAERARHELFATGETARRRSTPDTQELTAQEMLIAQLARDGLSNPEIGSRLFISARTVQYHLRKVFVKLDITSRSQLDRVLPHPPGRWSHPARAHARRGGPRDPALTEVGPLAGRPSRRQRGRVGPTSSTDGRLGSQNNKPAEEGSGEGRMLGALAWGCSAARSSFSVRG